MINDKIFKVTYLVTVKLVMRKFKRKIAFVFVSILVFVLKGSKEQVQ